MKINIKTYNVIMRQIAILKKHGSNRFTFIVSLSLALNFTGCVSYLKNAPVSQATRDAFSKDIFMGDGGEWPERVMLLGDEKEAFTHRLNVINSAQKELTFVTFLIQRGEIAENLFAAIFNAAERGVRVSFLFDPKSQLMTTADVSRATKHALAAHPNIEFYLYSPLNLFKQQHIHQLMHDKIMIVDNNYMIIGGRNIGEQYFDHENFNKGLRFLDYEVLVYNANPEFNGAIADAKNYVANIINSKQTQKVDELSDKKRNTGETQAKSLLERYDNITAGLLTEYDYHAQTMPVEKLTLLTNPIEGKKKEPTLVYNLFELARGADYVVIESPYFVLRTRSINNIKIWANDVDSLILFTNSIASSRNDIQSMNYHNSRKKLLQTGAQLLEYQSNTLSLHSKAMLINDRFSAVGSLNFNENSFYISLESMLVIDSREFYAVLREAMNARLNESIKVGGNNKYEVTDVLPVKPTGKKTFMYKTFGPLSRLLTFLL